MPRGVGRAVIFTLAAIAGTCFGTYFGMVTVAEVAEPHPIPARPYVDRLESYHVYDGDTLTNCTIDLGYGVVLRDAIRIVGIDTPEVSGSQRPAGVAVRDAAATWLSGADELWLIGRGRDKYGRILGDVQPPGVGQSLGEWLIEKGYAHAYDGRGSRPEWTADELRRIADERNH